MWELFLPQSVTHKASLSQLRPPVVNLDDVLEDKRYSVKWLATPAGNTVFLAIAMNSRSINR